MHVLKPELMYRHHQYTVQVRALKIRVGIGLGVGVPVLLVGTVLCDGERWVEERGY